MQAAKVILYELNEVPWSVVDLYTASRPGSALASVIGSGRSLTTVNEDPVHLQPWRTWPTFHTSLYTDDHGSFDLGQDPDTFRGKTVWDVADEAMRPVGIFGVLQSWPPRDFRAGGFFVPDSFAPTADARPRGLTRFQAFNVSATRDNGFAASDLPSPVELAKTGLDLARRGLTVRSGGALVDQLVRERRDPRYKSGRSIVQVLPCFDVYWNLHRRHAPDLSIFFTNHVAGVMHRFWGDGMPGYPYADVYEPDAVYGRFVMEAMDATDRQLGRILRHLRSHPDTVLLVASSMGQGPIPYRAMPATWVVQDPATLASALGLAGAEPHAAMYPRVTFLVPDGTDPEAAGEAVRQVRTSLGSLFTDVRVVGRTVSFEVDVTFEATELPTTATVGPEGRAVDLASLGIVARARPGGGNTAFHTPEGILLAAGAGQTYDASRREVNVLDAAPSILELMGVAPDPGMRGHGGLFV